ncbi:hypothetical protein D3C77_595250 [compost metagenome]
MNAPAAKKNKVVSSRKLLILPEPSFQRLDNKFTRNIDPINIIESKMRTGMNFSILAILIFRACKFHKEEIISIISIPNAAPM